MGNTVKISLWDSTVGYLTWDDSDFEQLFRRMVFNVLSGNIDDHSRNFSFLMDRSGRWSLAPAYDMVYSIEPSVLEVQKGQSLSICGKKLGIKRGNRRKDTRCSLEDARVYEGGRDR